MGKVLFLYPRIREGTSALKGPRTVGTSGWLEEWGQGGFGNVWDPWV